MLCITAFSFFLCAVWNTTTAKRLAHDTRRGGDVTHARQKKQWTSPDHRKTTCRTRDDSDHMSLMLFFKKKGNNCLKKNDVNIIISEIKSKLKILSIAIYYPIKSEISPLKIIKICQNLSNFVKFV